jgi:hypothetical protein
MRDSNMNKRQQKKKLTDKEKAEKYFRDREQAREAMANLRLQLEHFFLEDIAKPIVILLIKIVNGVNWIVNTILKWNKLK